MGGIAFSGDGESIARTIGTRPAGWRSVRTALHRDLRVAPVLPPRDDWVAYAMDFPTVTGRSLRHILRSPDTIVTTAVLPIAFLLLFTFVLGGAIDVGDAAYVDYLLPGILLITVA